MPPNWSAVGTGLLVLLISLGVVAGTVPVSQATATSSCPSGISFYGLGNDVEPFFWDADQVSIAVSIPRESNVTFVVLENDTVLGTKTITNQFNDTAVHDGAQIRLDKSFSGNHTIRVVAFADGYHPDAEPCTEDGSIVQEGPETIDFTTVGNAPTPTSTPTLTPTLSQTPIPTATPTDTPTSATGPGFGLLIGGIALVLFVILVGRWNIS